VLLHAPDPLLELGMVLPRLLSPAAILHRFVCARRARRLEVHSRVRADYARAAVASRGDRERATLLWGGAIFTAAAAVFFPRIQGIRDQDESWWRLLWFFVPQDVEGVILIPIVVGLTLALFALVGRWAWRDTDGRNRPALVGLVCSALGIAGVLVFFLSAPIILGGLGTTLGVEGRRRASIEGRGALALAAIVVGVFVFGVGASIWAFAEELGV
jgi:hypothetical protein